MSPTLSAIFAANYNTRFPVEKQYGLTDAHLNFLYYLVVGGDQVSVNDIWDYAPGIRWVREIFE